MGAPGAVDFRTSTVIDPGHNIDGWQVVEIGRILKERATVLPPVGSSRWTDLHTDFAKAHKRAIIARLRFYDLRHTFASYLVMNWVDLLAVKEILGHKSIDMTLRYSHLSSSHKQKAVEILNLFNGPYRAIRPKPLV